MSAVAGDTVVVFGATGMQGGSVLRSLLKWTEFNVRAVTRNKNSEQAKQLEKLDDRVTVVEADCNGEHKQLREAFQGAKAAFLVTDFWKPENAGKEFTQGKALGRAAKAAQVKQIIFSTLPNVRKESGGKWDVPHFTDKAEADEYLRSQNFDSYTSFGAPFYYQNLLPGGLLGPDKNNTFTLPDLGNRAIDMFDVTQTGDIVIRAFLEPDQYNRAYLTASGDTLTFQEAVATFRAVNRIDYKLNLVKPEEFPHKELGQMFGWFRDFGYFGRINIAGEAEQSGKALRSLREFLEAQKREKSREEPSSAGGAEA